MPSSISSSERALPRARWGREWAAALVLALAVLAGWETTWRKQGFPLTVGAFNELWLSTLHRVRPDSCVVLGTSRIQAALEPAVWAEATGRSAPLQLAVAGGSPLPLLEHLAERSDFHGLVLAELLPMFTYDASQEGEASVRALLARYASVRPSLSYWSEAWLSVHVAERLVFRQPPLCLPGLLRSVLRGQRPKPSISRVRADRFQPVEYARMVPFPAWNPKTGFTGRIFGSAEAAGRTPTEEEAEVITARLEAAILKLESNGATVVALHMPACGDRAEIEERRFPRALTWDRFAAQTSAVALDLGPHAEFPRFDCYDGSHLDAQDAPRFTRALFERLRPILAR